MDQFPHRNPDEKFSLNIACDEEANMDGDSSSDNENNPTTTSSNDDGLARWGTVLGPFHSDDSSDYDGSSTPPAELEYGADSEDSCGNSREKGKTTTPPEFSRPTTPKVETGVEETGNETIHTNLTESTSNSNAEEYTHDVSSKNLDMPAETNNLTFGELITKEKELENGNGYVLPEQKAFSDLLELLGLPNEGDTDFSKEKVDAILDQLKPIETQATNNLVSEPFIKTEDDDMANTTFREIGFDNVMCQPSTSKDMKSPVNTESSESFKAENEEGSYLTHHSKLKDLLAQIEDSRRASMILCEEHFERMRLSFTIPNHESTFKFEDKLIDELVEILNTEDSVKENDKDPGNSVSQEPNTHTLNAYQREIQRLIDQARNYFGNGTEDPTTIMGYVHRRFSDDDTDDDEGPPSSKKQHFFIPDYDWL